MVRGVMATHLTRKEDDDTKAKPLSRSHRLALTL